MPPMAAQNERMIIKVQIAFQLLIEVCVNINGVNDVPYYKT